MCFFLLALPANIVSLLRFNLYQTVLTSLPHCSPFSVVHILSPQGRVSKGKKTHLSGRHRGRAKRMAAALSCLGSIIDDAPPLCRESNRNFLLEIPPDVEGKVKGKLPGDAAFRSLPLNSGNLLHPLRNPEKTARQESAACSKPLIRDALRNANTNQNLFCQTPHRSAICHANKIMFAVLNFYRLDDYRGRSRDALPASYLAVGRL